MIFSQCLQSQYKPFSILRTPYRSLVLATLYELQDLTHWLRPECAASWTGVVAVGEGGVAPEGNGFGALGAAGDKLLLAVGVLSDPPCYRTLPSPSLAPPHRPASASCCGWRSDTQRHWRETHHGQVSQAFSQHIS